MSSLGYTTEEVVAALDGLLAGPHPFIAVLHHSFAALTGGAQILSVIYQDTKLHLTLHKY